MDSDEKKRKDFMIDETISEFEVTVHYASQNKGDTLTDYFESPYFDNLVQAGLLEKIGIIKRKSGQEERDFNQYRVTEKGIEFLRDIEWRQAQIAIAEYEKIFPERD